MTFGLGKDRDDPSPVMITIGNSRPFARCTVSTRTADSSLSTIEPDTSRAWLRPKPSIHSTNSRSVVRPVEAKARARAET